jgi:hypothetical protein
MVPKPKGATGREGERGAAMVGFRAAARVGVRAAARVAKGRRRGSGGCEGRGKSSGNGGCGGEGNGGQGGGRARATGAPAYILDQRAERLEISPPNGWLPAAGPAQPFAAHPNRPLTFGPSSKTES